MKSLLLYQNIKNIKKQIREEFFQPHNKPWIIGFSGGKDSILVVHLVIDCILSIAPDERKRRGIYIVCNDTLVESPVFQLYFNQTLLSLSEGIEALQIPIKLVITHPDPNETFWVNLLGRGYPAPNPSFRWCVDRLKIRPTSKFLKETISESGESILIIGVRKDESIARAQRIERYSKSANYSRLIPHNDIHECLIFRPIMDLSTDDVWLFLNDNIPPWGGTYDSLFSLYRDANGGDWPFFIQENGAPSPSKILARFGCWTCTVIKKDKSLESLYISGYEYLKSLLDFRDSIKDISNNPEFRSKIRRNGQHGLGPITMVARKILLEELISLQDKLNIPLISTQEIRYIYEQWENDHIQDAKRIICGVNKCVQGWTCVECSRCNH